MTTQLEKFVDIFELPPAMVPYVQYVADEREIELVVGLNDRAMTLEQLARLMQLPKQEAQDFLTRAFRREIVNKRVENGLTIYTASTFYARMDVLAMFENELWRDVPPEARNALQEWQLQEYINTWMPMIEQIQKDPDVYTRIKNRDILLLDEALELVEAASEHVITRCDCRSIMMVHEHPISEVCVRLSDGARLTLERGQGRKVSKDEMRAIVVDTDRSGLIHAGLRDWRGHEEELFGFCNCSAAYCYPIRAGIKLGMPKQYPRVHYMADRDPSLCDHCELCVERCQFGAFYSDTSWEAGSGSDDTVRFDPSKCWGCGLCANGCPEGAISMQALDA